MNITLIFPPQFDPSMPHLALPCLTAVLRRAGHHVTQRDVNLELYDSVLTRETILGSITRIENYRDTILERGYPPQELDDALMTGPIVAQLVESAKETLRDPRHFYNYERYSGSLKIIDQAMLLFSLPYYPTRLSLYGFVMEKPPYSTDYIVRSTQDNFHNPFIELYEKYTLPSLLNEGLDVIGISISYEEQLAPGLTLARMIKQHRPDVHVVIGGNILTRHRETLVTNKRLFRFFDSLIVYEGETAMVEMVQRLEDGRDFQGIPNLFFKKDDVIHPPTKLHIEDIKNLPTPDFSGLPMGRYFSPVPILPAYMSRGCYWQKCAFCTSPNGQDKVYRIRPSRQVAQDLTELREKWQSACFAFVDEAIPPQFLGQMADDLLATGNAGFSWLCWARFDPGFSPQVLQKLRQSGCAALLFGLESACDRVLDKMNKGIKVQTAREILLASNAAGIVNHTGILIGFPTETVQEALETVRFVLNHHEKIQSIGLSLFNLDSDSQVMLDPDRYGVQPVRNPDEDLASAYDYTSGGINREVKRQFYNEITQILEKVFPYHILSLHRFLFTLPGADPDINACTVDQELDKCARIKQRDMRVTSAFQRLAELENQIEKGEKRYGD